MDRVTKESLLATIRADRARFEAILTAVPRNRLTDPVLAGGWSVMDVLAHIAWGDREGIGVMEARALVGSELWDVPEEERNDAVVRGGIRELKNGEPSTATEARPQMARDGPADVTRAG